MGRGFDHSPQDRERPAPPPHAPPPSAASLRDLAPRLGNQAFGRLLAATERAPAASVQRVLFIKSSSIQERDADSFNMAYDKTVKPVVSRIVVEPNLRPAVRAKLLAWASATGITPRRFQDWDDAVKEAYNAVKPPTGPNTNMPQPPSSSIPSTSEIKEEKTEIKEPNTEIKEEKTRTRREPTEEERFWMKEPKQKQSAPKVLTKEAAAAKVAAAEKELTLLLNSCQAQVQSCFVFLCNDWKSWKNQCVMYLDTLSRSLQSAVRTLCEVQISYCMCQADLYTVLGNEVKAATWAAMAEKGRQRLPLILPQCTLVLDQETWVMCQVFANSYLEGREGELTESVKTAQKKARSTPLAALRAQIYRDLSKQFALLAPPSKQVVNLCRLWSQLLAKMAQQAEGEAQEQSELHAGRNQSSHF
jgi:hypothetical protein